MKVLIFALFCVMLNVSSAQKIYSVYFSSPQPQKKVNKFFFDADIIGTYQKQDDELVDIVIDSTSVVVRYITAMFLTTSEINSNPKFEFKNNLLFGIDNSKGLEYFIENDTVYFGVFQKEVLFQITDSTLLKKEGNDYFLNYKTDDFWETVWLYSKDTTLYLRMIDITQEEEKVKKHLSPLTTDFLKKEKVYISSPSAKSFLTFVKEKGFYDIVKYTKQ